MLAAVWHGRNDVQADTVPDPVIRIHRRDHSGHLVRVCADPISTCTR